MSSGFITPLDVIHAACQIADCLQNSWKNFQPVFYYDESVCTVLFLPEMCTKISTKKILMSGDFLPLVAKQGQTRTVQGQTSILKYVRIHISLPTQFPYLCIYVSFFLCFRNSFFLPLLEAKTCSLSALIFLWVRMLSELLAFLSPTHFSR